MYDAGGGLSQCQCLAWLLAPALVPRWVRLVVHKNRGCGYIPVSWGLVFVWSGAGALCVVAHVVSPRLTHAAAHTRCCRSTMQGSRVSAGLGPVQQVSSLKFVLRSVVLQQAPPAFDDAIAAIDAAGVIPDIRDWGEMITENAQDAKEYGKLKGDPLSADGIAYVMGYSDEATTPPLYADMNNKSYDKDRSLFTPYSQYMVGLVKHMKGIEVYPNHQVFRGVKVDLRDQYPQGRKVTWHGFCSTTKSAKVLENPLFCGEVGKRTIFAIQLTQGQAREISRYSLVESEDEILLPPGCKFEVQSVLPQGDLTIIQLLEVASKDWVFDLSSPAAAPAPTPAPTPAPAPAPAPAPGMFQFGDLLKELGVLEADAPAVQPILDARRAWPGVCGGCARVPRC